MLKFWIRLRRLKKEFRLHVRVTCSRHAKLHTPNHFLMKVERVQITGNKNAVQNH